MLQFRIVHCIQDVGKQVLDEEERGIAKQLRILDQATVLLLPLLAITLSAEYVLNFLLFCGSY